MTVCGPKLKLSIFTSALAAAGWSAAVAFGDPTNSSSAIITGIAKPATHTFLLVIFVSFPGSIFLLDLYLFGAICLKQILGGLPKAESITAGAAAIP
jgi:hypothetical protein